MNRLQVFGLSAVFLLSCCVDTAAQEATGTIIGNITDPTGAAVPHAMVTVTSIDTNIAHPTTSDDSGHYQVLQLPIGKYRISAEAPGFERTTVAPVNPLEINQSLRVDVQMSVGKLSTAVTVESEASMVETENSTVAETVTGQAIFELPLNGRDTLDLLRTQPGVTESNPDSTGAGLYSIGGQRSDS